MGKIENRGLKEVNVLCAHCAHEYDIFPYMANIRNEFNLNFMDCPSCGKRNDFWIKLTFL